MRQLCTTQGIVVETFIELPSDMARNPELPMNQESYSADWQPALGQALRARSSVYAGVRVGVLDSGAHGGGDGDFVGDGGFVGQIMGRFQRCAERSGLEIDAASVDDADIMDRLMDAMPSNGAVAGVSDPLEIVKLVMDQLDLEATDVPTSFLECMVSGPTLPEGGPCALLLQAVESDSLSVDFCEQNSFWCGGCNPPSLSPPGNVLIYNIVFCSSLVEISRSVGSSIRIPITRKPCDCYLYALYIFGHCYGVLVTL